MIRRILKHYGWSNIKLMGHSLGGIIAFLYSACYPTDVDALVSLDVVAPIFEFTGKKSVPQMAALIDKYDNVFTVTPKFILISQTLFSESEHQIDLRYENSVFTDCC